jgi:hypothetical protein
MGFEGFFPKCGADAFAAHGVFDGLIVTEEVEGEFAQQGEVLGGVAFANASVVFVEGRVQDPVAAVLDTPMAADQPT